MAERNDFSTIRRDSLLRYLKTRDVSASKYKKDKLIELAEKAHALEIESLEDSDEKIQERSFWVVTLGSSQFTLKDVEESGFSPDLRELPIVSMGDVLAYGMTTRHYGTTKPITDTMMVLGFVR